MLVFWKENLVLLAVPKTGTTALSEALAPHASTIISDPPILKHAPIYRYNRFLRPFFEGVGGQEIETVAMIREPVDWLGSWYRYRRRPHLNGNPNSTAGISFDTFVDAYLMGKRPAFAEVGSQAKFVTGADGAVGVDHLFCYEQPDRLIRFLEDRLQITLVLPRSNVSPRMDVTLSPEIEARLRRKRADEFAIWETSRRRL
jgi:hypothetical protein